MARVGADVADPVGHGALAPRARRPRGRSSLERTRELFEADAAALLMPRRGPFRAAGARTPADCRSATRRQRGSASARASSAGSRRRTAASCSAAARSSSADGRCVTPTRGAPLATWRWRARVVPMVRAVRLVGLLLLGSAVDEAASDSSDLELLLLAADRMALAVDHAQRFAEGRVLVETLQRSLLPESLPHHPRLELAARYLPVRARPAGRRRLVRRDRARSRPHGGDDRRRRRPRDPGGDEDERAAQRAARLRRRGPQPDCARSSCSTGSCSARSARRWSERCCAS